jgi:5-methylcytosine-specific restriction protein A
VEKSVDYGDFKRSRNSSGESLDLLSDLSETARSHRLPAERQRRVYFVYKRNQRLIRALKEEYNGTCQICGTVNRIETDSGEFYTEGHHLIPLGDRGYDALSNVAILCPLCHKKLHYSRDRETLKLRIVRSEAHTRLLQRFR